MIKLLVGHYYKRVYSDGNYIIFRVLGKETECSIKVNIVHSKGYRNISAEYITPDDALIEDDFFEDMGFGWATKEIKENDLVWELIG